MTNSIQSISLDKLIAHPDNPNRMSRPNMNKLMRNIKRSGLYEPLVVRTHPKDHSLFEIINGYHRCKALRELGYEEVDCVVWEMNDEQADILLGTLNRLCGTDELTKKLTLLKRLNKRIESAKLAKLLPQTARQIERLANLKMPTAPETVAKCFATPLVFFVNDTQQKQVEKALSLVEEPKAKTTKAARRAAALVHIAGYFLNHSKINSGSF
jgi:ParB family chromosome partitioning protein